LWAMAIAGRVGQLRDLLERVGVPTDVHPPDSAIGRAIRDAARPGVAYPGCRGDGTDGVGRPDRPPDRHGVRDGRRPAGYDFRLGHRRRRAGGVGGLRCTGRRSGCRGWFLEAGAFGGQAGTSSMIRNYLGFPQGITGRQLGRRAILRATGFGAVLDMARAVVALDAGAPHGRERWPPCASPEPISRNTVSSMANRRRRDSS
jgi:thioredoxin reductase (NADPH)